MDDLEKKRAQIMGFEPTEENQTRDEAVLLAVAAGVLPSVVSSVLKRPKKEVQKIIKNRKQHLLELCEMLTVEYQEINLHLLFDDAVSRIRDIINDQASNPSAVVGAAKEVLRMIKEGDAKKSLNNEIMNSTYEDVPANVEEMKRKIEEIQQKKKALGL